MVSLQRQRQKQQLLAHQEARNHDHHFPVGSEVEVHSDEEGFKGVWRLAKVLKSSSSKSPKTKLYVEYNTLFSDDGSEPRKTLVDCKCVRPLPPTEEEEGSLVLEINDAVDAYYHDGWWEDGVVTNVAEDGKYNVFFQNPPRELEFDRSDLRVHKDWIDGKWVWPEKQKMKEFSFSPRTDVEVNLDRDSSHDIWFPATIVSPTIKESSEEAYLVQFNSQIKFVPLKLVVGLHQVRPSPPSFYNNDFQLLEKVDAFYDGGWSSGVVTKVLGEGRYIVFFKHTKKEKEMTHKELRIHMEWINGKWFHPSQDVFISSSNQEQLGCTFADRENGAVTPLESSDSIKEIVGEESAAVTLKSDQGQQMPCGEKPGSDAVTLSNKKTRASKKFENLNLPKMSGEETSVGADVSSNSCQLKAPQMVAKNDHAGLNLAKSNVKKGDMASPTTSENGSQHSTKAAVLGRTNMGADKTEVESPGVQRTAVTRKRGRPPKSGVGSPRVSVTDVTNDSLDNGCTRRPEGSVLVIGLACNGDKGISPIRSPGELPKDEPVTIVQYEKTLGEIENKEQRDSGGYAVKRKRGRPPKLHAYGPRTPGPGKQQDNQNHKKRTRILDVDSPSVAVEPSGINDVMPPATRKLRARDQAGKKGQRWKIAAAVGYLKQDSDEEKVTKVVTNGSPESAHAVAAPNSSNASDDDQPLSTWLEGAHSPQRAVDDTRITVGGTGHRPDKETKSPDSLKGQSPVQSKQEEETKHVGVVEDVSQHEDAREREDERLIQPKAIVPVVDLPFVKSSLIWKTIESMEVFQLMPQKPHFTPLCQYKEECREGLAIGNMVTFASLVEKVCKYGFEDPKSVLVSSMDALVDLEKFGFDVNPVRNRLRTLICLKDRHEQAQNTSREIGTQIMERNKEKSKINGEIEVLDGQIKELQEKRALAVSLRERKDSEITILRSSVDAVKESIEDVRAEFKRVATAPW